MRVALVGSGPSAFFLAERLTRVSRISRINIIEKLHEPFGLINYGVAPDHPEVKNCTNGFTDLLKHDPKIRLYLGIEVGKSISLRLVQDTHDITIISTGASESRALHLSNSRHPNYLTAKQFFGWYNKLPNFSKLPVRLDDIKQVVIIGHGNVAIDIARILGEDPDKLRTTDINFATLNSLYKSKIEKISLVGRRGPLQASFTTAELRELATSNTLSLSSNMSNADITLEFEKYKQLVPRGRRRLLELLISSMEDKHQNLESRKKISFDFFLAPKSLSSKGSKLTGISFTKTAYEKADFTTSNEIQEAAVLSSKNEAMYGCDLVISCVGFEADRLDDTIPYDAKNRIINVEGKVAGMPHMYTVGWAATGSTGNLATTLQNVMLTHKTIVKEVDNYKDLDEKLSKGNFETELEKINVPYSTFKDWLETDELEKKIGSILGKSREKLVHY